MNIVPTDMKAKNNNVQSIVQNTSHRYLPTKYNSYCGTFPFIDINANKWHNMDKPFNWYY